MVRGCLNGNMRGEGFIKKSGLKDKEWSLIIVVFHQSTRCNIQRISMRTSANSACQQELECVYSGGSISETHSRSVSTVLHAKKQQKKLKMP